MTASSRKIKRQSNAGSFFAGSSPGRRSCQCQFIGTRSQQCLFKVLNILTFEFACVNCEMPILFVF